MPAQPAELNQSEIAILLRGDVQSLQAWSSQWNARRLVHYICIIVIGAGLYGAAIGWWRDPIQALYTATKFPLIILLTAAGNAMLNAMLAPLLGLNIPFRQSFLAIVMSFTISSAILGSFAPIIAFLVWNTPPMSGDVRISNGAYDFLLFLFVVIIAFGGVAGNLRLLRLLRQLSPRRNVAARVLFAWLAGNLFLGAQLSWILRPFVGSPGLPVQFFRADAFKGNFYETIFRAFIHLFGI